MDADDPLDEIDEDDSDMDDDSDNEAELMAELDRIRKERAVEKAAKEARDREEQASWKPKC
jgi:protein CWC15